MSLLTKYATPAELAVGCSFADGYESAADVVRNGGEIFGTPTVKNGVIDLNGTTDHVKYKTRITDRGTISFVVEFYPNFSDDGQNRFFFDSSGSRYAFFKANGDDLRLSLNGTLIFGLSFVLYSSYWRQYNRNVIVLSIAPGDTSVWLNGVKIVDSDSTVYIPAASDEMFIGSNITGAATNFDGKIGFVKVFDGVNLTEQDAIAYYNGTMYNYLQRASVVLPFSARTHDPTNYRTLDVSGRANNFELGNGAGTGEPIKSSVVGYSFNSIDQYMDGQLDITGYSAISIGLSFCGDGNNATSERMISIQHTSGDDIRIFWTPGNELNFALDDGTSYTLGPYAVPNVKTKAHLVFDGTFMYAYIDGVLIGSIAASFDFATATGFTRLGVLVTGGQFYGGEIYDVIITPEGMSKIQVMDDYLRSKQGANNV